MIIMLPAPRYPGVVGRRNLKLRILRLHQQSGTYQGIIMPAQFAGIVIRPHGKAVHSAEPAVLQHCQTHLLPILLPYPHAVATLYPPYRSITISHSLLRLPQPVAHGGSKRIYGHREEVYPVLPLVGIALIQVQPLAYPYALPVFVQRRPQLPVVFQFDAPQHMPPQLYERILPVLSRQRIHLRHRHVSNQRKQHHHQYATSLIH